MNFNAKYSKQIQFGSQSPDFSRFKSDALGNDYKTDIQQSFKIF